MFTSGWELAIRQKTESYLLIPFHSRTKDRPQWHILQDANDTLSSATYAATLHAEVWDIAPSCAAGSNGSFIVHRDESPMQSISAGESVSHHMSQYKHDAFELGLHAANPRSDRTHVAYENNHVQDKFACTHISVLCDLVKLGRLEKGGWTPGERRVVWRSASGSAEICYRSALCMQSVSARQMGDPSPTRH